MRSLRARPAPSMRRSYSCGSTTLGDLLLDVIVQLERPLVPGDDQVAVTRTGAGGQAANVAAWARALGADARYVGKRGDDAAGELVARELRAHGVELVGPVGGRTGVVVSHRGGRRPHDGVGPRRGDRARRRTSSSLRGSIATCCTSPATRCSASPLATAALRAGELARARRCGRLARPLDVDARRRRLPRTCRDARARHVFANERERDVARRAARRALGRQARRRAASRWTASTIPPCPSTSSTRPAPATRSPPASSSAGRRSGSRPPLAAARSSVRCRDPRRRRGSRGAGGRARRRRARDDARRARLPAGRGRRGRPRLRAGGPRRRRRAGDDRRRSTARSSSG